ncbi:hypothetical protein QF049_005346 [Paenibacillus sp. W4I10]|uniref:hypothetical protein n=1 Tax=Paenibacillus sp. W4I10 TaxID=3042298 RepID=UPI0027888FF5|nr:hypothetical protein [Paenibacillus sp. W4I10]MDQ0724085.1 hypothetical protein [Paenibacillus sp. W4I10]
MIKINRVIFFILLFLICNVALFVLFKPTIQMQITSKTVDADLNAYYDNLTENYPFDDAHATSSIILLKDQPQKVSFTIPSNRLNKLRIDFGLNPGVFEISNLTIETSLFYKTNVSNSEIIQTFTEKNDIGDLFVQNQSFIVKTNGEDGFISTRSLLDNGTTFFRIDLIIKEIFFILLSLIVVFFKKVVLISYRVLRFCKITSIESMKIIRTSSTKKLNFFGFILVVLYALALSIIFDRLILNTLSNLAGFFNWNTVNRYFEYTNHFSIERIYFFFIFFFVIGFVIYLGIRRAIKYRYLIALLFLVLIVCGKFTGSSIGFYDGMLVSNTSKL